MTFADTDVLLEFLPDRDPVAWTPRAGFPETLLPLGVFAQDAPNGLEVALVQCAARPSVAHLRSAWTQRKGNRASPVLLVAVHPTPQGRQAVLYGPVEPPSVFQDVELHQAERLADTALNEPNRHQATRLLLAALPELDSDLPGLRNMGLLATQELEAGVRQRTDWGEASPISQTPSATSRPQSRWQRLGFEIQTLSTNTSILTIDGRRQALAVFCDDTELMDAPGPRRFDNLSPVSHALAVADNENVPWVVLTTRLGDTSLQLGGRQGRGWQGTDRDVRGNQSVPESRNAWPGT